VTANVPCAGCTACCTFDLIMLHPEMGDRASDYLTMPVTNPLTGEPGLALQHKKRGGCIYLGEGGCTIHGRAPAICREFDCRRFYRDTYMTTPRPERRRWLREGLIGKDVIEAGKSRLHTLEK
jgi:Fe-S-cluster containining protein